MYLSGRQSRPDLPDENSVIEHLEQLSDLTKGEIRFQETTGLQQVYINSEKVSFFDETAKKLLENYYEHH
jgi:hypothetical protein